MAELEQIKKQGGAEVLKASAGSGKTFTLAREYIRLLLLEKDPLVKAHRHILAVTFTNKATSEMKTRIVSELDRLSREPEKSDYCKYLMKECGYASPKDLGTAAGRALRNILSDYGMFSVSTIDRFFQQTLRAFAREIGQFAEYRIELDRNSLISESVDRVLDSLSEGNGELLDWLSRSSIEKIESGEGYHLESNMQGFASGYLSSDYRSRIERLGIDEDKAFSQENVTILTRTCRDIIRKYDEGLHNAAVACDNLLRSFPCYDKGIQSNVKKKVIRFQNFNTEKDNFGGSTWAKACDDPLTAVNKDFKKLFGPADLAAMADSFNRIMGYSGKAFAIRRTAPILLRQVYVFCVADSLKKEFDALLEEKNVLSIEDTNSILRDIIGGSDAPFVYEKTGTRYKYFLLDEFQDTSNVQWENFRPLLQNSISEGCYNLIVGDVKQSIYRWRDADWSILGEKVGKELPRICEQPLDTNWRSARNIVDFNNSFHASMAAHIGIADLYSDVSQKCSGKVSVPGCVEVNFCSNNLVYDQVVLAAKDALSRGFRLKDIAVIVRTNAQGGEIASRLMAAGIHVITNDSLRISNGLSVRQIVSGLFLIDNPDDRINTWLAPDFDLERLSEARSLSEMADSLAAQLPAEQVNADTLYLLAFMDVIRDFVSRNGNSLHAFLKYWTEDGMKKSISSPEGSDAVTVITIHKCKGLSYPYVILPLPYNGSLHKCSDSSWESPDVSGTELEVCENALYDVSLSAKASNDTLFQKNYEHELSLAYVDNANTWYVAMTRAEEQMCIIAQEPTNPARSAIKGDPWPEVDSISDVLYLYVVNSNPKSESGVMFEKAEARLPETESEENAPSVERYVYGELTWKAEAKGKETGETIDSVALEYAPEGHLEPIRGNIRISNDAADFFAGAGETSPRKRGSVLHGILEHVLSPEDLGAAVKVAVESGSLAQEEAGAAESLLSGAIASVSGRGWFDGESSDILDERDIIVPGGDTYRPDRVVLKADGVDIIDYKFGAERYKYNRQVSEYMSLYRRMGYRNVRGYLWYVEDGRIEEVLDNSLFD